MKGEGEKGKEGGRSEGEICTVDASLFLQRKRAPKGGREGEAKGTLFNLRKRKRGGKRREEEGKEVSAFLLTILFSNKRGKRGEKRKGGGGGRKREYLRSLSSFQRKELGKRKDKKGQNLRGERKGIGGD